MAPRIPPVGRVARAVFGRRVPVYAHWGVTHRCNLTCKMCGIWRYGNLAEELSLAEVEVLAARLKRLGVIQLALGGGEPFQREDIEEVVAILLKKGLNVRVLTNGVDLSRERLDRMISGGLAEFAISLDSLYPARFDYICEREGTWEQVVRTITTIAALLRGKRGLPTLNCVVSHLNLEELPELVAFARAVGFAISFLPVELLDEPSTGAHPWEDRFIRFRPEMRIPQDAQSTGRVAERVDRAYDALVRLKREGAPILNSTPYLQASRHYLKTGRFPSQPCDAGRLYFSIAPNGQYTICHRALHQHKHFLDEDFEAYFRSAEYERLRKHEVATCEGCMRACWIDTSFMFRTIQGLTETARTTYGRRTRRPLTFEQARTWARYDMGPVVPRPTAG